ncbi:hypothetical protein SAMN05216274_104275 [Cryobacterium levicorallinum]|uniref:Uncharacterized protein n=1 Tax=Cryobacterium levicorallinum TaxID=995038 RepID=A0ABY1EC70_9MICO|nr:hypothetical protein SAMN05216274_104275 [Cryobacterium levicorallinum]
MHLNPRAFAIPAQGHSTAAVRRHANCRVAFIIPVEAGEGVIDESVIDSPWRTKIKGGKITIIDVTKAKGNETVRSHSQYFPGGEFERPVVDAASPGNKVGVRSDPKRGSFWTGIHCRHFRSKALAVKRKIYL